MNAILPEKISLSAFEIVYCAYALQNIVQPKISLLTQALGAGRFFVLSSKNVCEYRKLLHDLTYLSEDLPKTKRVILNSLKIYIYDVVSPLTTIYPIPALGTDKKETTSCKPVSWSEYRHLLKTNNPLFDAKQLFRKPKKLDLQMALHTLELLLAVNDDGTPAYKQGKYCQTGDRLELVFQRNSPS